MKYRKKPVVIEAVQWTGENHREMFNFLENRPDDYITTTGEHFYIDHDKVQGGLIIKTPEGEQPASIGDFIVKGVNGEFHPCEPDVFSDAFGEAWKPVDEKEENDSTDEIVRGLRICAALDGGCGKCGYGNLPSPECTQKNMQSAANRIEQQQARIAELEAQLADSQQREQAAEADLMLAAKETQDGVGICIVCKHYPSDMSHGMPSICDECPEQCMFEWRGPQEAGDGEPK